jgi:hypothetical protein
MTSQPPPGIKLRDALASPPPAGATLASFVLFASLAALMGMVYAGAEWYWSGAFGFSSDAAWVRAVLARNLASGHGLSFNPDVPVAGAVAPAWIVLLAIGGYFTGYVFAAKVIAVICVVLAAFLVWRVTLDLLGDWRFALLAGLMVVSSSGLMAAALGGGEAALAALLIAALLYWQGLGWSGSGRQRVIGSVAAAAVALSRPELILALPLMALDRWLVAPWQGRPGRRVVDGIAHSLPGLVVAALLLVPYVVFSSRAGGPLWPQPETALRAQPALAWATAAVAELWASNPLLLCAAVLGLPVAALAAARPTSRYPSFLPVLTLLVVPLAPGLIWRYADRQGGAMTAAYLTPVVAVLGSAGLFFLKRVAGTVLLRSRRRVAREAFGAVIGITIAGLFAVAWFAHARQWNQHGIGVRKVNNLQVCVGQWAADRAAPDASIASREIGAIGFFSHRRMVDLGGTIDREGLAYLRRAGSPDSNLLAYLQKAQPSYLAIRPSDFPDLSQRADLLALAQTCGEKDPLSGGVTTLVLYETIWPAPSVRAARQEGLPDERSRRR